MVWIASACATALGVGVARALTFWYVGMLPDAYLLAGVAWNAGIALAGALIAAPAFAVLGLLRVAVRQPGWAASLGAALAAVLPFGVLDSGIAFGAPLARGAEPLLQDARRWLPLLVGAVGFWALALRGLPPGRLVRRALSVSVLLLLVPLAIALLGASQRSADPVGHPTASRTPHVFLILVDTLRADHLGTYGYRLPTSPNIDRFAADATVYERAFAQSPWTRPSCAALFTGRYPAETGVSTLWHRIPPELPILPQFLRAEGYRTGGVVSSVHVSAQFGFDKGFDHLDIGRSYLHWTGTKRALRRLGVIDAEHTYPRYDARELTDRAIAWLDDAHAREPERPLFLYLHYADPHSPYAPPPADDRWREFAGADARRIETPPEEPDPGRSLAPAELGAMVARYDAEVAFLDRELGRLFQHLHVRGLYEEALIVLTSDHGEEFLDHGALGHGHSLYNELLHVPLILRSPASRGGQRGARRSDLAALIDVVPTIQSALGARWPAASSRGRVLLDAPPSPDAERLLYAENETPRLRSVFAGSAKLIQQLDARDVVTAERLYSLAGSLIERLADSLPVLSAGPAVGRMRSLAAEISAGRVPSREITVDETTYRELQLLGYVE
jgi:arylsulfatase A-like enzyme